LIALGIAAIATSAVLPAGAMAARNTNTDPRFAPLDLPNPLAERQANLKAEAQQAVLKGQAKAVGKNKVVKLGKKKYVQLAFQGEDKILTTLSDFSNVSHSSYPGGLPGPVHNNIPQPDRSVDNTTIWAPDFNQSYYQNLLFNKNQNPSMANWYLTQSSGQYSVTGSVSDWTTVTYNEARYGRNVGGDIVSTNVWQFVNDSADAFWNNLVAQQGSVAAANAYLAQFDVWDRYDYDGDGNVNEPDGYIDHYQAIHAGQGEETGGGAQGADAIWSHRWYAYYAGGGPDAMFGSPHNFGGVKLGGSNLWIGDYTIEPENGGVGVFTHEFGHDLGLPDEYDTSGNVGGAENSTGWWTNWSQGSYGTIDENGLGMYPVSMTDWERFQLGFLDNYAVAYAGDHGKFKLGPSEYNTKKAQAMFVVLPDKQVSTNIGAPAAGTQYYYSGAANNLDTTMTRDMNLPANAQLSAKVRYSIESGYDFAYLMVDGTRVDTSLSNSVVVPEGIDGNSGGNWVDLTADLSAFPAGTHEIGFGYQTDVGAQGDGDGSAAGFAIDEISITGQPVDGAETDTGWAYSTNDPSAGFHRTSGAEISSYFNAYVIESRSYQLSDVSLLKGPYNFLAPSTTKVEHFPYQDGVLIWYWDDTYRAGRENNVGDHPGHGWILPVDSHPGIMTWADDGSQIRPRIQSYDATFTNKKTEAITLHNPATGVAMKFKSLPGVTTFNDTLRDPDGTSIYWTPTAASDGRWKAGWNSVDVPNTGTVIKVSITGNKGDVDIQLN
jgi:immune inhibitor A